MQQSFFMLKKKVTAPPTQSERLFRKKLARMGANRLCGSATSFCLSFIVPVFICQQKPQKKGSCVSTRLPVAFYWISIFLTSGLISGAFGSSSFSTPFSYPALIASTSMPVTSKRRSYAP